MGKGDKKTKRGKITRGSYGNKRPRKTSVSYVAPAKPAKKAVKKEEIVEKEVKTPVKPKAEKKPTAKKTTAKKAETTKKSAEKKAPAKKAPAKKAAAKKTEDKKEE